MIDKFNELWIVNDARLMIYDLWWMIDDNILQCEDLPHISWTLDEFLWLVNDNRWMMVDDKICDPQHDL